MFPFFECCNPMQASTEPDHLQGADHRRVTGRATQNLFSSADGALNLYYERWEERSPARAVVIAHPSEAETAAWYNGLAMRLHKLKCSMYCMDMQGYGQSDGHRGYFERFEHLVDDYVGFVEQRAQELERQLRPGQELPQLFLLGKGLGALVALSALPKLRLGVTPHLILVGGAFEFSGGAPGGGGSIACGPDPTCRMGAGAEDRQAGLEQTSEWFPKMVVQPSKSPEQLARDPQTQERLRRDCLVYNQGTKARVLMETWRAQKRVGALLRDHTQVFSSVQCLLLHGTGDRLYSHQGSFQVADAWGQLCLDRRCVPRVKAYEGANHMLFHEPNREEVITDVSSFILQRCDERAAVRRPGPLAPQPRAGIDAPDSLREVDADALRRLAERPVLAADAAARGHGGADTGDEGDILAT